MRTSLLIAAHNEGDRLWKTVSSCLEATRELDVEVVVADDASEDGSVADLKRRFPGVPVHSHPRRQGVSPTKDLAARRAGGQVLVFLDAHTKPEPGAIEQLVSDVEATSGQAVFTPAVPALNSETWENKEEQVGNGYRLDLETFATGWIGLGDMQKRGDFYECPALIGCVVAVHRDLYEKVRGFDRDMLQWGVEDIDFGLKVWLLGHSILHDPRARVGHRFQASFDGFNVSMDHVVANQLRMARKNFHGEVWSEWVERCRPRHPADLWDRAWSLFLARRSSAEDERKYLLTRRTRDELWYAAKFALPWPTDPSDTAETENA